MASKVPKKRNKKEIPQASVGMAGMYRVNIVNPDGTVAGDSGWKKNVITNVGLSDYIVKKFLSASGSLVPAYFALGSGNTSLASNATSLPGQIAGSQMVALGANSAQTTRAAQSDADTAQYLATFSSNIFEGSTTIGCAGLHATSTPGSVMCGGTFASSTVATNQAVNCTYQVLFSATVDNN